jgi:hypothetical protein
MMLTPDTLAQLSPPDRLARLQDEALAHYGTERNKTDLARDFDLARSTITTWNERPELIPAAVILCLAAWNAAVEERQFVRKRLETIAAELSGVIPA